MQWELSAELGPAMTYVTHVNYSRVLGPVMNPCAEGTRGERYCRLALNRTTCAADPGRGGSRHANGILFQDDDTLRVLRPLDVSRT